MLDNIELNNFNVFIGDCDIVVSKLLKDLNSNLIKDKEVVYLGVDRLGNVVFDSNLGNNTSKYVDIIQDIENLVLRGVFKDNKYFKCNTSGREILIEDSLGSILSMYNLILGLKQNNNIDVLIIEEPELGLGIKAQWELAKVLVKLYNKGLRVVISTKSDIILQHINNMYKLSKFSGEKKKELQDKYNYGTMDLIYINDFNVYTINTDSKVNKEDYDTIYGFLIDRFNSVLEDLYLESRNFIYIGE